MLGSKSQISITNLSSEELKNILRFVDEDNKYFSSNLKNKLEVKVRYDSYNSILRFDLVLPESWIPTWTAAMVIDAVRSGMVH